MRLSIGDAHVYITQALQQQGAFKKDKQFIQAVDFALNKAVHKFIRSCLKPIPNTDKFQVKETSREDIQSLIVTNTELTNIRSMGGGRYFTTSLPSNFKYLINDLSYMVEDCEEAFNDSTENRTRKINYITLGDGTLDSNDVVYKDIILNTNSTNYTISHSGFTSIKDKSLLVDLILYEFKKLGVDIYWETFGQFFKKSSFIIPSFIVASVYNITIDGIVQATSNELQSLTTMVKTTLTSTKLKPNRNVKNDDLDNICDSYYSKPRITSPVSVLASDQLEVYSDKKFLVNKILLDYVRQPRPVNLSLGYSFDLHESTHDRICDIAVEILKEQIEDKSLDKTIAFNQLKNNT